MATERLLSHPDAPPREPLVVSARCFLEFCVANPGRFHRMLQRTVAGFEPTDESLAVWRFAF